MDALEAILTRRSTRKFKDEIVNVASGAHKAGRIHFNDINLKHGYNVVKAYSQSKPANSSKRSKDTELARKLFELSENIVSK